VTRQNKQELKQVVSKLKKAAHSLNLHFMLMCLQPLYVIYMISHTPLSCLGFLIPFICRLSWWTYTGSYARRGWICRRNIQNQEAALPLDAVSFESIFVVHHAPSSHHLVNVDVGVVMAKG
jgi:hypothetical protein